MNPTSLIETFAAIGRQLFDSCDQAVFALAADGRVVDLNPAARRLVAQHRLLACDAFGRLQVRRQSRWCEVADDIGRALQGGVSQTGVGGQDEGWSVLGFNRLPGTEAREPGHAVAIATLRPQRGDDDASLRSRWHLTPAEARVARLLARGASPAQIANTLEVRMSTVRTHLQHLYEKTGAKRQVELVARLLAAASGDATAAV